MPNNENIPGLSRLASRKLNEAIEKKVPRRTLLRIIKFISLSNAKPRTALQRLSHIKRHLRKHGIDDPKMFDAMKPRGDLVEKVIALDRQARKNKENIRFGDKEMKFLLSLDTSNLVNAIIVLQLMSGRRIHEIVDPVYKANKVGRMSVRFDHLSKQRNAPKSADIRLLGDADRFLTLLKQVRSEKDKLKFPTSKVNRALVRYGKGALGNPAIKSSHTLRGMYAAYLFKVRNPSNQNINGFITDSLNHSSGKTSMNYSNFIYQKDGGSPAEPSGAADSTPEKRAEVVR